MKMNLLLWMVVMMMVILPSSTVTASSNISLKNCPQTCGNVSVPYPFGFGNPECAKNSSFLLNCTQDGSLFLGKIQIYDISLENSTITAPIDHPAFQCYNGSAVSEKFDQSIRLDSWPLVISPTHNTLSALGCNTLATVTDGKTRFGWCVTFCHDPGDLRNKTSCSGFGCCQTSIPKHLNQAKVTVESLFDRRKKWDFTHCSYAFLAAKSFNILQIDFRGFREKQTLPPVPVVFEWTFGDNQSCPGYCGSNAYCINSTNAGHRCRCLKGFTGNPYLPEGCQDIDECDDPDMNNCRELTCRNTIGSYTCENKTNKTTRPIILGISLGFTVVCLVIGAWWLSKMLKKRRKLKLQRKFFKRNGGLLLQQQLSSTKGNVEKTKIFSTKELERATDNFNMNRILGQGGQGTVYKGMLVDGRIVAVKKSKVLDKEKVKDFINEVVILTQINHRNIVKLLGCCLETEVPLLVYEFIPNGTLFQYIHDENEDFSLSWERRLTIAAEIASALSYLHSAASIPIYHRDVKSSNILLDEKCRAKVSDFGASRSITVDQTHLTTNVQGKFGYLDPEYYQSSQFTEKSDVYSFGVVLVELLTGEKAISLARAERGRSLASHFILSMEENNLFNILDARIRDSSKHEEMTKVAKLAYRCLGLSGKNRPRMIEVAMELEQVRLLQNNSNGQQNHEQIRDVKTEVTSHWDVVSRAFLSLDAKRPFSSESLGLLEKKVDSNAI